MKKKLYDNVIIWGGGTLGKELFRCLKEHGIRPVMFWDLRAEEIRQIEDISVELPFSNEYDRADTEILICVTNPYIVPHIIKRLKEKEYFYIDGFELFQEYFCTMNEGNVNPLLCNQLPYCNTCSCNKLDRSMSKNGFTFNTVLFNITQKCSLRCKYCSAHMNDYPVNKKVNFETEQIIRDIDQVCDAVDYITRAVPYGGEPFLHPDLDKIVERLCSKKNVGIVNLVTNGIFSMTPEQLERFHFKNLRISFSNYSNSITREQQEIVNENQQRFHEAGIPFMVDGATPEWTEPADLLIKTENSLHMQKKKANCTEVNQPKRKAAVKNGLFFPCGLCDTIHSLEIAEYSGDYLVMREYTNSNQFQIAMHELYHKDYYETCMHCGESKAVLRAGTQEEDTI